MHEREQFIILVDHEPLRKADAIVVLEGDGFSRLPRAKELFDNALAPLIFLSGGDTRKEYGSFPARELKEKLISLGVPAERIEVEEASQHTREQALAVLDIARKRHWHAILLVASHYHQYRAFLTFLRVVFDTKASVWILNAPARDLPWFSSEPYGIRFNLLENEFTKIEEYAAKDHVATFREAIEYQKKKELEWNGKTQKPS